MSELSNNVNQMSKRTSFKNRHDYNATGSMTLVCVGTKDHVCIVMIFGTQNMNVCCCCNHSRVKQVCVLEGWKLLTLKLKL